MSYFIDMDTFSFIHISDLHIGKKLNGYDLHEDQKYVLEKIVDIVRKRKPDAVLIAGDVYDRTNPSEDAIALLNDFLVKLQATGSEVFVIGGNHDPGEKLSFLSNIVDGSGLHIVGKFSGKLEKRSIGNVDIYLLPYIRTCDVRRYFPDSPIESTSDALRVVLDSAPLDKDKINVLVAHQAVLDRSFQISITWLWGISIGVSRLDVQTSGTRGRCSNTRSMMRKRNLHFTVRS